MRQLATVSFLVGIVFLTGCGNITGQWTLDCINPESARQSFDLKCLVLNKDNTFMIKADAGAKTAEMCGTYCYDDDTKTLTFTAQNAPTRTYMAELEMSGKMKVCPTGEKAWTAYLKRCKCENSCPQSCGKPCDKPCEKSSTDKPAQCPMQKAKPEPSKSQN